MRVLIRILLAVNCLINIGCSNSRLLTGHSSKETYFDIESAYRKGDFTGVLDYYNKKKADFRYGSNNDLRKGLVVLESYNETAKFDSAIAIGKNIQMAIPTINSDSLSFFKIKLGVDLAMSHLYKGNIEESKSFLPSLSLVESKELSPETKAYIYRGYGLVAFHEGRYRNAQDCFEEALENFEPVKESYINTIWEPLICQQIMADLAKLMFTLDNFDKAINIQFRLLTGFHSQDQNLQIIGF